MGKECSHGRDEVRVDVARLIVQVSPAGQGYSGRVACGTIAGQNEGVRVDPCWDFFNCQETPLGEWIFGSFVDAGPAGVFCFGATRLGYSESNEQVEHFAFCRLSLQLDSQPGLYLWSKAF